MEQRKEVFGKKDDVYLGQCMANAFALCSLYDVVKMRTMRAELLDAREEILKEIKSSNYDMERALHIASNVALHNMIPALEEISAERSDVLYQKLQNMVGVVSENMKEAESVMTDSKETFLHRQQGLVVASLSNILSSSTESKISFERRFDSKGVSFIDHYESFLQKLMERAEKLEKLEKETSTLIDSALVANTIWENICSFNKERLNHILSDVPSNELLEQIKKLLG